MATTTADIEAVSADALRRHLEGDGSAFVVLIRAQEPRLRARIRTLLRGRADEDDVVQNVWLNVHRQAGRFRWQSQVSTWVYSIATCEALMALRGKTHVTATVGLEDHAPLPDTLTDQRRTLRRIRATLRTLPLGQRAAFLMHVLEGAEYPGGKQGRSTPRRDVHSARTKLRRCV